MKIDRKQIRYSLQLLLHLQKNKITSNQDGYAMLITSILAILMFSMLSVYLFSANLYKSVANAVVDSGSTFYAAESGMNQRANIVRDRFVGYSQPIGAEPSGTNVAAQMQNCISNLNSTDPTKIATLGSGDLSCRVANFDYKESLWKGSENNSFTEKFINSPDVKYRAYSFVKKLTVGDPDLTRIPPGDVYAGLNMQEYRYRLYSTALKNTSSDFAVSAQTLLQMDFNSQLIPLFQFAAFYQGNLEVSSSTNMSLNGPVHSNSSIYYGPGGVLTVGQTTAVGSIFKSLIAAGCSSSDPALAFPLRQATVIGTSPPIQTSCAAGVPMTPGEVAVRNVRNNSPTLTIPGAGFLDRTGDYFTKADLQVTFDPNNVNSHPYGFGMTSILRDTSTTPATTTSTPFTDPMLRSLRQPVMVVTQAHGNDPLSTNKTANPDTTEWRNLCVSDPSGGLGNFGGANFTSAANLNTLAPAGLASLSIADATTASAALRNAIAKYSVTPFIPFTLTQMNTVNMNAPALSTLKSKFSDELNTTGLSTAQKTTLLGAVKPREIANKAGNCFLPAPMQILTGQRDRQENRDMKILQSNIHSLTVWNRNGVYTNPAGTNIDNASGKVFALTAADSDAPVGSYAWMGMAASDTSERGLVWHSSVDPLVPAATRGVNSEFGFGFSGGRRLPGPLTIATDQIAYIQGDLNNPGGLQPTANGDPTFSPTDNNGKQKRPAAVMADAIAVLSNNCVNGNGQMDCFNVPITSPGTAFRDATRTTVNAAFLSGTSTGGGLNNYMRMMENWHFGRAGIPTATSENLGATIFRYRGSFVSLGARVNFPAPYSPGCTSGVASATCYYNVPARDFGFDTSFNTASGLPPLSPQVVFLKQKVFRRDYNSDRN